jgi:hypothetical protein
MTDMRGLANNAREIDVLAVRALGIVGLNYSLLRASVQRGTPTVRAITVGSRLRGRAAQGRRDRRGVRELPLGHSPLDRATA